MRFTPHGPSIPDELLTARDEGRVVFFCGAGVSRARVGLADFVGLATAVADKLAISAGSTARQLIDQIERYVPIPGVGALISADRVFGLIERDFAPRDIYRAIAQSLKPPDHPDLAAHRALVQLARGPDNVVRIVTTNFDLLFEDCDSSLQIHRPPRLPDPRRSNDLQGIIHLHGHVSTSYEGAEGDGLVISSAEFGRAYLSEQWATNFVRAILEQFVVVFVGYAADDPPMQYLLEALNRSAGSVAGAYAFQAGNADEAEARWIQKGVKPIVYDEASRHAALWDTLFAWADRAKNPERWFSNLITQGLDGPERLPPHVRGQVAHMVSTVDGARRLARANPTLPAVWLCTFDPRIRYEKPIREGRYDPRGPVIDPFNEYALDSDRVPPAIDPDDYMAKREVPTDAWHFSSLTRADRDNLRDDQLAWLAGHYSTNVPRLSARLSWLGDWFAKVSSQPAAVWWAAQQNGMHNDLQVRIEYSVEAEKDDMATPVRTAWHYIFEAWKADRGSFDHRFYHLLNVIKKDGWTPANVRRLTDVCRPYITAKRPFLSAVSPPVSGTTIANHDLVSLAVEYPAQVESQTIDETLLPVFTRAMRQNLELAVSLETEIGGYGLQALEPLHPDESDPSRISHRHGISSLTFAYLGAFKRLTSSDLATAREELSMWSTNSDVVFTRMIIWACADARFFSADQAAATITLLDRELFWDSRNQRDILVSLSSRMNDFDEENRQLIENKLLEGRTRWEGENEDDFQKHRAASVLARIYWLSKQGWKVSETAKSQLATLHETAPEWKLEYANGAAQSFGGRAGWVKTDTDDAALRDAPIADVIEIADSLTGRTEDFFVERDPFAGLVKQKPLKALAALSFASKQGQYPVGYWQDLLNSEAWKQKGLRFSIVVSLRLARLPNGELLKQLRQASDWLHRISEQLLQSNRRDIFEDLWDRLCATIRAYPDEAGSRIVRSYGKPIDWSVEALNSPAGKLAQAILTDPLLKDVQANEGLPAPWSAKALALLALPGDSRRHALTFLALQSGWLFWKDPEWIKAHVLIALASSADDRDAFWAGFFWASRIPPRPMFELIRPALLQLASEKNFTKRQHAESLAAMLLAGWVSKDDSRAERLISSEQIRDVLISADDDFRSQTIGYLNRWSRDKDTAWYTQTLTFIADVWPRQNAAKSSQVSARLVELAFFQMDRFEEYARAVLPLLVKIDRDHLFLGGDRNEPNEIVQKHPGEALALLSAILPEDAQRWPYGITDIIAEIGKANPDLMVDPRLVELNRIAGR